MIIFGIPIIGGSNFIAESVSFFSIPAGILLLILLITYIIYRMAFRSDRRMKLLNRQNYVTINIKFF